jgi:hypothetical protein
VTRATVAVLMILTIPLAVTLISVSREAWHPTGDMAQAELHVAGFFSHPPLIGAAGRIGDAFAPYGQGSHPGPAMWVALLPAYLLTGRSSFGLELGMTVMQLAFLIATVVAVRRLIGAIGGLLTAVTGAVLVHSLGPAPFIEPWNPWGGVYAFFCFIALCWGIVCGRHRWLPAAAFCGFFAVQCHAGYVLLVGAGLAAMVAIVAVRWRRDRPDGVVTSWWITVAVTVAMWTPPIVDQLRRSPGNLRILWHYFTSSTEPGGVPRAYVGLGTALKAFAGEVSLPGPWIRGDFRLPAAAPNLIGLVAAVAVIGLSVRQLSSRADLGQGDMLKKLFALLGGATAVGIVSTARVFGEFFDYVIRWWWMIVAWIFLGCALVLIRRVSNNVVIGGALAVAVLMSGLATANAIGRQNPGVRNSRIVAGIDMAVASQLDRHERYQIRWLDPATLGGVPFGVLLDLEKRGFSVGVDAVNAAGALPHRVFDESTVTSVLWVVLGDANIGRFRARADATELGHFDQRSATEMAEGSRLLRQLVDRLDALGLSCLAPQLDAQYGLTSFSFSRVPVPPDVARLAYDYAGLGLPVAVFRLPPLAPAIDSPSANC